MINQIPQYEFTQRVKTLQEKMIQEKARYHHHLW